MSAFVEDRSILSRTARKPDAQVRYGALAEQMADVWYGEESQERRPLVVFIHGGYWRPSIDRAHAASASAAMAEAGFTAASIEYRRIPGQPDMTLGDVESGVGQLPSLVRNHNGSVIVMGHSAGGHLALWAAVKCSSSRLKGALALGPVADLEYGFQKGLGDQAVRAFLGGSPSEKSDVDPTRMPDAKCRVTLVHGEQDAVAPIAMSEHYCRVHLSARLKRIDQCGHFALIDPTSHAWPIVLSELKVLGELA